MPYVNLNHRKVCLVVDPDDFGGVRCGIPVKRHLNLGGLIHDMVVRQDVTLFVDNDAGTETSLGSWPLIGEIEEAIEEVLERLLLLLLIVIRSHLIAAALFP